MSAPPHASALGDLRARLDEVMCADAPRLRRRVDRARRLKDPEARAARLRVVEQDLDASARRAARRQASRPRITYPQQLPISHRVDDLAEVIRDHQVVILAGETGSGKTTQLPKICLQIGRGTKGLIGHTQPRRLAARTVAERIAEELGTDLGQTVGYQVRFTSQVHDDSLVKLMTDGILLAELGHDPLLRRYDTLIIDEAHERSLNVDVLIGYLRQVLPKRPDLKVIITSATIDPERFSRHFDDAPIVEVSGRTYPVEVRYRPLEAADADDDSGKDREQVDGVCDAVTELWTEGSGDVLVFLPSEAEIRETEEALRALRLPDTELLPLYSRLPAAEQRRVFRPSGATRRVVLATNVAETSLTVPGIRYVVDTGTARISRHSSRTRVQRLPIEKVSQASADQRKGRCGRTSDGICIRLYAEDDFVARPLFTEPEILRTDLASVVLRMASLGLGDVAAFPFLDPPDRKAVADGTQLLAELGAVQAGAADAAVGLTAVGRVLARLPIDPRLGRMLVEADRSGCLHEVLIIVSGLAVQDPRERPAAHRHAADASHARFADADSDFLAYLNLWDHLQVERRKRSGNAFKRACKEQFLHHLRVREWQGLHTQLRELLGELRMKVRASGLSDDERRTPIHQAILAGLLSQVGMRDPRKRDYAGARGARFAIFPGSGLFGTAPSWVMAAELVETSRLWAREVARIDPAWAEPLAAHLVKRHHSEPRWSAKCAGAVATERVTLYGLPLVAGRTIAYAPIDPEESRALFIRHALVDREWRAPHRFLERNAEVLEEVAQLEERTRRRDLVVDADTVFAFYDDRIPAEVVSGRHFDSWWKEVSSDDPDLLTLTPPVLVDESAAEVVDRDAFPDAWVQGETRLPLRYQFEPGHTADGVTVDVPLTELTRVSADGFDWHIPGLRLELVTALLRSLPKDLRRQVAGVPDVARQILDRVGPGSGPLLQELETELRRLRRLDVPRDAWDWSRVPAHLRLTFRITDGTAVVASGGDLERLRREVAPRLRRTLSAAAQDVERAGLTSWTIGDLPRAFTAPESGVVGFPALVDAGDHVDVRVLDDASAQRRAMVTGTRRLLRLVVPSPVPVVGRGLDTATKLALSRNPHGDVGALLGDCLDCAVDGLVAGAGGPAWDAEGFARLVEVVRADVADELEAVIGHVRDALAAAGQVEARLAATTSPAVAGSVADCRAHLNALVHAGFLAATGRRQLAHLPRYLTALDRRLEKLPANPHRDRALMVTVGEVAKEYRRVLQAKGRTWKVQQGLVEVRWMLEELHVALFAQELGTAGRISEQRVYRALADLAL